MSAAEKNLFPYSKFRPSSFDSHIEIKDRETWLVFQEAHNRDSDALAESNFYCALEAMGGESDDVEVHRFRHWANGWYEIVLVRPGSEAEQIAIKLQGKLEDYPVLDEDDFSQREMENE
jgi:hypothetical protein